MPLILVTGIMLTFGIVPAFAGDEPIALGCRRELFVDHFLIDKLDGVALQLQHPQPAGIALKFDRPWEGQVSGYVTVIHDGDLYRIYYRGRPLTGYGDTDPRAKEVTCYAESRDGITFTRPQLGLVSFGGNKDNNVILADAGHVTHNFAPFLDTRPSVPASERFKAVGGSSESGLIAYVSADGIHFRKLQDLPIITGGAFDSQNNVLWSDHEQCYVCFFRTFRHGVRWITRTTSADFLNWTPSVDMTFGDAPNEHLYTNQTVAYFRAPHMYVGTAARFWPGRRSLTDQQVAMLQLDDQVNYGGLKLETSDAVLLTSRGGNRYDRTFLESLVRPGADLKNWTARSNYPARGIVPTGPMEMSMYIQRHYGQPTHYLERLTFRTDGLAAVHAGYQPGELVTAPITFAGRQLTLNLSSSAAGGVLVEIQDAAGKPIPGFTLAECSELSTDDLARVVSWKNGADVSSLAGKPIRLRFRLKDADLFALQFVP
ncbi:MAG: hypothetical protein A2W31_12170 [Planctomycetes bacterium RBG_16_64_10]|nr:MAG: hypothetical protein A2W31_12170 [Planctomycetes bacterium RBG_16_64_10]